MNKKVSSITVHIILACLSVFILYKSYNIHSKNNAWAEIQEQLNNCNVRMVSTGHSGGIIVELKDRSVISTNQSVDIQNALFTLAKQAQELCNEDIEFVME